MRIEAGVRFLFAKSLIYKAFSILFNDNRLYGSSEMLDIAQGAMTADLGPYLNVGSNAVRIQVSDVYENSRTINFNVNAIEASISSTLDAGTPFEGIITFTYAPVGNISKTVHILLDGKELTTVSTSSSGRQMSCPPFWNCRICTH